MQTKMKILISDFVFENTHKDMNMNFVRAMARFSDCTLLSVNEYYSEYETELFSMGVHVKKIDVPIKRGALAGRITSLKLISVTEELVKKDTYNGVIVLCFETTIIPFKTSVYKDVPMFLFHHRNIDELTNYLKSNLFKIYKNKVYHVVFEEFFKQHMIKKIGINDDRLFVIPHPAKEQQNIRTDDRFDCVGLCNSNDEVFVQNVIDQDARFEKFGYKVLLRSKVQTYNGRAVTVIKGYIKKEKYDEYISASKNVFVPFPDNYVFRLSGSIYDALSRRKKVFTTSKYYSDDYERRYPNTCNYIESVTELIEKLADDTCPEQTTFDLFLKEHSIDKVSHDIEAMMRQIIAKKKTE